MELKFWGGCFCRQFTFGTCTAKTARVISISYFLCFINERVKTRRSEDVAPLSAIPMSAAASACRRLGAAVVALASRHAYTTRVRVAPASGRGQGRQVWTSPVCMGRKAAKVAQKKVGSHPRGGRPSVVVRPTLRSCVLPFPSFEPATVMRPPVQPIPSNYHQRGVSSRACSR